MSTICIVQARYGSSRFPGKPLEMIGGWSVLEHVVRRAQVAVPDVLVAIPNGTKDARIWEACRKIQVPCFLYEGDESDVLGRYAACAREHKASVIVRITADCPFIDPTVIATLVQVQRMTGAPYVSNLPANPDGHDCEVFTRELLDHVDRGSVHPYEREHVTVAMRHVAGAVTVQRKLPLPGINRHRWTLDTPADLAFLRMVAKRIQVEPPVNVTWALCELLSAEPELAHYETPVVHLPGKVGVA